MRSGGNNFNYFNFNYFNENILTKLANSVQLKRMHFVLSGGLGALVYSTAFNKIWYYVNVTFVCRVSIADHDSDGDSLRTARDAIHCSPTSNDKRRPIPA